MSGQIHYIPPSGRLEAGFNRLVRWLAERGIGLAGAQTLRVRGRVSGQMQVVPVNPIDIDGTTYLVSPRGATQWVRNLRAAQGECVIRIGRRSTAFAARTVPPAEAVPVVRAYVARWGWEIGRFLPAPLAATSSDGEVRSVAELVPVFALTRRP